MTPDYVRGRLALIKEVASPPGRRGGDPETAHEMEDDLWRDVLKAIAVGEVENPQRLAAVALESGDIHFPRWYA